MNSTTKFLVFLLLSTFIMLLSASALAVDDIGEFEMDGDAVEDNPLLEGDDWGTLWNGGDNLGGDPVVFTGINPDPAPRSIFEGGNKDIHDISDWTWKSGSVPDKDNITNAYAAAYRCPGGIDDCDEGDLIAFFGADRSSNKGDAFLGFWFFKGDVSLIEEGPLAGTFSGSHAEGDALVLVNFPQASGAEPEIRAVAWDSLCTGTDHNLDPYPNPQVPGANCAAKNLRLLYDGVVCGEPWPIPGQGDDVCAITNSKSMFPNDPPGSGMEAGTIPAPWNFVSKNPDPVCLDADNNAFPHCFPYDSFFEGGINLTRLAETIPGGDPCFASFMAETRSSKRFTASLKDFSLDQFPLCAVELSKTCGTGTYNTGSGYVEIPFSVTVSNTGAADVAWVTAIDDGCGELGIAPLDFGPLLAGESETITGTCMISPGPIGEIYNSVTAVAVDDIPVLPAESCITDAEDPGVCIATCDVSSSPDLLVHKYCDTRLLAEDGVVKVKVVFNGDVTNTSDQGVAPAPLRFVEVRDDSGTGSYGPPLLLTHTTRPAESGTSINLDPGETATFESFYLPDGDGIGWAECPEAASFTDWVKATGYDVFTGHSPPNDLPDVEDTAPATCTLCEEGNCD